MGRTVINETENKQTVILNDSPEGIEGGYFDEDMVWHEFGGGGEVTPILTISVQNDDTDYPYTFGESTLPIMENNNVLYKGVSVASGESYSVSVLVIGNEEFGFVFKYLTGTEIFSDMVNCTYDEDEENLIITDPTKNASVHFLVRP